MGKVLVIVLKIEPLLLNSAGNIEFVKIIYSGEHRLLIDRYSEIIKKIFSGVVNPVNVSSSFLFLDLQG